MILRFSIRWLFAAMAAVAVSTTALMNANEGFAGLVRVTTAIGLLLATVTSFARPYWFWRGFALVGTLYGIGVITKTMPAAGRALPRALFRLRYPGWEPVGSNLDLDGGRMLDTWRVATCLSLLIFALVGGLLAHSAAQVCCRRSNTQAS